MTFVFVLVYNTRFVFFCNVWYNRSCQEVWFPIPNEVIYLTYWQNIFFQTFSGNVYSSHNFHIILTSDFSDSQKNNQHIKLYTFKHFLFLMLCYLICQHYWRYFDEILALFSCSNLWIWIKLKRITVKTIR